MDPGIIQKLLRPASTKIVLLVLDGLGGLPIEPGGLTELEAANTPNLDDLAKKSICGLHQPVGTGITPGSGPSHLALFGYDPVDYQVGRGVLGALGINFPLRPDDVAARGNFCTIDEFGKVIDRRAGRIPTEKNRELCELLQDIDIPGIEFFIEPEKEYRFLFVMRGESLSPDISDTDPQTTGLEPCRPEPLRPEAEKTARFAKEFLSQAREALRNQHPANMVLLRGFSKLPDWPTMDKILGIKGAAIAAYPMYRGLAKLIGMEALPTGEKIAEEFETLRDHWLNFDFFYLHVKPTDSAGEDGSFDRKVSVIEQVDSLIPRLHELSPDVLVITGDHSTPSALKSHSWHPVPVILWSRFCRPDMVERFGERACVLGSLGPRIPATELMTLALANARRLQKFGA